MFLLNKYVQVNVMLYNLKSMVYSSKMDGKYFVAEITTIRIMDSFKRDKSLLGYMT